MNKEDQEIVKKLIKELMGKMTFSDFSLEIEDRSGLDEESAIFNIRVSSSDSSLLIGQQGATLKALQYILRVMARRRSQEKLRFLVDVNDYRKQKVESLAELAKNVAKEVIEEKRPIVLRPMSAYERRIIHMKLAGNGKVETGSIGEGEDRRVVVKPLRETLA